MTDYAFSASKPRELSLGHRLLLWIETSQQRKADREISRVRARFGIKPEWHLSGR